MSSDIVPILLFYKSVCPLFSLTKKAQRKKLGKKETPKREFRTLRSATRAPRPRLRHLLEKAAENLISFALKGSVCPPHSLSFFLTLKNIDSRARPLNGMSG